PGVADVAGVRRAGHARHDLFPFARAARINFDRATVARSEKLPLLQSEVRQLIETNEQKLGALITIDVVLVAAVAKERCGTVLPGDDVLGLVVAFVQRARDAPPEFP